MTSGQGDGRDRGQGGPPAGWPPPPESPGSRPPATPGGGFPAQPSPYPLPGRGPAHPPPPGTYPPQGSPAPGRYPQQGSSPPGRYPQQGSSPPGRYPQQGDHPPPGRIGQGPYPSPAGLDPPARHGVAATSDKNTLSVIAIALGVIAVLILPILFGPAGIICGVVATNRKERLGKVGLIVAIAGTVLGFVVGFLLVHLLGLGI